jgi:hypothetical protein
MPVRTRAMADATPVPTVSDFDFIMSTILRQGNDSPLRKALLKHGILDLGNLMCLNDRDIGRLKYPDSSSDTKGSFVASRRSPGRRMLMEIRLIPIGNTSRI